MSYSSNSTPRPRSVATTASRSSTSQPIWVCAPLGAPADANSAKRVGPKS